MLNCAGRCTIQQLTDRAPTYDEIESLAHPAAWTLDGILRDGRFNAAEAFWPEFNQQDFSEFEDAMDNARSGDLDALFEYYGDGTVALAFETDFCLRNRNWREQLTKVELLIEQLQEGVLLRNENFDAMRATDPRRMALDWILHKDDQRLVSDSINLYQRFGLAVLAYSMDSKAWKVCDCSINNLRT